MRVLLVHPDFQREPTSEGAMRTGFNPPALGVNVLAEVLRMHGHSVDVLDSVRLTLRYGPGASPRFEDEVHRLVVDQLIDVIAMNITSPTRLIALRCARAAKTAHQHVRVVCGGPHATILGAALRDQYSEIIDAVVCGEGEDALPQLLYAMETGRTDNVIPGVHWQGNEFVPARLLPDLDCYPAPRYDEYRNERYGHLFDTAPVMTARGCPRRCAFCYSKEFWSGHFRTRNTEQVVDDIEYAIRGLGCTKVHFNDDIFSQPLCRSKTLLASVVKRGLHLRMYCTTRIDVLDEDFLALFEQAGGGCMYFGIETGSQRLRDTMGKHLSDDAITHGVALLRRHAGIRVGFFLMLGYPGETDEDIVATRRMLANTRPHEITCNIAHVHPSTSLFASANENGLYAIDDWLLGDRAFFPYEQNEGRLGHLQGICRSLEQEFGTPTHRSGFIRDVGSVPTDAAAGGKCHVFDYHCAENTEAVENALI